MNRGCALRHEGVLHPWTKNGEQLAWTTCLTMALTAICGTLGVVDNDHDAIVTAVQHQPYTSSVSNVVQEWTIHFDNKFGTTCCVTWNVLHPNCETLDAVDFHIRDISIESVFPYSEQLKEKRQHLRGHREM